MTLGYKRAKVSGAILSERHVALCALDSFSKSMLCARGQKIPEAHRELCHPLWLHEGP